MKRESRYILLFIGEMFIFLFAVLTIRMYGEGLFWYFIEANAFFGTVMGVILILIVSGLLMDFLKAFPLSIKTDFNNNQGRNSLIALKCAIISATTMSAFVTIVGLVAAQNSLYLSQESVNVRAELNATCVSQSIYGVIIVLLLIPVYFRLKMKMESICSDGDVDNV